MLSIKDLPAISLCIPARNETHALEDCLNSAIASDYPKLEIIVLDDCSQDKTSQIIRGFAHEGVRFVQGAAPSDGWLGKNHAYQTLAGEARGQYLVFMSVDTRFSQTALTELMTAMRSHNLNMSSVLPVRRDIWRVSVLLAPLRYFWQVVSVRRFFAPTASSLWAIRADSLQDSGGFEAYKDEILIENKLARRLQAENKYRFLLANRQLDVWYAKKWRSQVETAIRLWYPRLRNSFWRCFLAAAAHFFLFVGPLVGLVAATITGNWWMEGLAFLAVSVQFLVFFIYGRVAFSHVAAAVLYGLLSPILALQEIGLIFASFYAYKRGRVDWKGRNVCFPVYRKS